MMNGPLAAILVSTNETLKRLTMGKLENHNFFTHFLCAGTAGIVLFS